MRIVHICLACFYVEGWGYQENILPKVHAKQGNDVFVLTSDYMFNSRNEKEKKTETDYINPFGVHVKVLKRSTRYGYYSRYNDFENVYGELEAIEPDVIFVHGGQFVALKDVVKYQKNHKNIKLFLDQHGDYYNMPVVSMKNKIIHKLIYGHWIRKASKVANKYWGVTPWRCQYLNDVYGVSKEKIGLLTMGGDDEFINSENAATVKSDIRKNHGIDEDDFVVVTGGKIDRPKNIHLLINAVKELDNPKVKLIVFGQPNKDMESEFEELSKCDSVRAVGWIESAKAYDYFLAADLAVFPGTHSVLWEQACACGVPSLFKDWEGMHHVCVNGNAALLQEDSVEELKQKIGELVEDKDKYAAMKKAAEECKKDFYYSEIAKRAIGQI